jgi:hypothetical protein
MGSPSPQPGNPEGEITRMASNPQGRSSLSEIARVATADGLSIAPALEVNASVGEDEMDGPPISFGSTRREILIVGVCTWAPSAQVRFLVGGFVDLGGGNWMCFGGS